MTMLRVALDGRRARKFRLFSTSLSVLIGVAFLAGSMVLIDTIDKTFDDLFVELGEDIDAVVRSDNVIESDFGDLRARIDDTLLAEVLAVDGVAAADGDVGGYAQLVAPDGDPVGNIQSGPPTLGVSWTDVAELNPLNVVDGRAPQGPDEIAIDKKSADDGPFSVGDRATVLLQGPPREFTVVGVVRFGDTDAPLGASLTVFDLDTAQEVLAEPGKYDSIGVVAESGIGQDEIVQRIGAVMPAGHEVVTGAAVIEESQDEVADSLSFFNTFMLVFAAIALFVAAFIIYNTFSILVAQRTRELALLRALGASRLQVVGSVMMEAVLVGLVASLLGLVAGIGVASLLKQLLELAGIAIPAGGVVFRPDTAWTAIIVGVGVTVVSAIIPARRASATAPMAAIREVAAGGSDGLGPRLAVGFAALVVGLGGLFWGLFGDAPNTALAVGGGAALAFVGVAALSPAVARPFSRVVGTPIARLRGVPGELAQENAMRNPKRTATTAAALMIGVGLVAAITIFAESAKASINQIIDDSFVGDLVVDSGGFGFGGLSPELAAGLNELPEVEAASGVRLGLAEVDGENATLFGVDPATMNDIVDVGVIQGAVEQLDENDLAVHEDYAADRGWEVGDSVEIRFPETGTQPFEVSLIFTKDELTGDFFIGYPAYEANFPDVFDFQVYVLRDDEFPPEQVRVAVESVAAAYPTAEVQDLQEFKDATADQINQLLGLIYALLGLAIIIALIGIANTLALTIIERNHELGLLRAVGMTRPQLRSSVRWEAVLIALLGTTLGAVIGFFFGWVIVEALADEGFNQFRVPVGQLAIIFALAVLAGVVASARPSYRAAKMDVLEAVAGS
ncbi:MAG: ABC transporter permease [Acidimicrobiales bacterium]